MLQENNILILNKDASKKTVVWLHGLGASPEDFTFFGELFPDIKWVLPAAQSRLITIYQQSAPAWFDIKSLERQDDPTETGILETHQRLCDIIEKEDNPVILGGFSQGAAQALFSGLNGLHNKILGIIAMSGYCPFIFNSNKTPPILIMHGQYDDVVSWPLAQKSYEKLITLSSVSHFLLPCAHSWHPDMQLLIKNFIKNTV